MNGHDYRFNYGALKAWSDANPDLSNRQVARKLGFSDVSSFRRWLFGETEIPVGHLLKFCNMYQVPLEFFFFDNGATAEMQLRPSGINDQTEPTGGWLRKNEKGGPNRPSPFVTETMPSIVPDFTTEAPADATEAQNNDTLPPKPQDTTAQTADMTQIFVAYQQALQNMQREHIKREDEIRDKYETKWDKERDELMTIIRSQHAEIEKMKRRDYRYGMVGEEE